MDKEKIHRKNRIIIDDILWKKMGSTIPKVKDKYIKGQGSSKEYGHYLRSSMKYLSMM